METDPGEGCLLHTPPRPPRGRWGCGLVMEENQMAHGEAAAQLAQPQSPAVVSGGHLDPIRPYQPGA